MSSGVRQFFVVLVLIATPITVHVAMASGRGLAWAGMLVVIEVALLAWFALSFVPSRGIKWIGGAMAALVTAAIWRLTPDGVVAASAMPHAIAYFSVLTIFASSLLPGRKPVITVFAERSRGELTPAVARYTRRVTWAWCLFCLGQLLTSLTLLVFWPVQVWSAFVNLCNFPLLVAMFSVEFVWRIWHYGGWPRERLIDGFRMARQLSATPTDARGG